MIVPAQRVLDSLSMEFGKLLPLLSDSGVDGSAASAISHALGLLRKRQAGNVEAVHQQFARLIRVIDGLADTSVFAGTLALAAQAGQLSGIDELESHWLKTLASFQAGVVAINAGPGTPAQRRALLNALVAWEVEDRTSQVAAPEDDDAPDTEITVERLTAYLRDRFSDPDLVVTRLLPLAGGFGKQTIIFAAEGTGLSGEFVIRRDIGENAGLNTSCHLIHREFPVIRAAFERGFPAPDALWLDTEHRLLPGGHFIVMRKAEGALAGNFFGAKTEIPSDLADILATNMAQLHALGEMRELGDITDTIRGELWDMPLRDCVERYIRNYYEFYLGEEHTPSPGLMTLYGWLFDNIPDREGQPCLIHGDIGFHNFLIHDGKMTALLDWEFAHLGDPADELGYVWVTVGQSLDWDRFMDRYRAAGGRDADAETIRFYAVWAYVRNTTASNILSTRFITGRANDLKLTILPFLHVPPFIDGARKLIEEERGLIADYVTVAEAASASGMRLVVTQGIPGPWGEAAKGILHVKRIDHLRVAQLAGDLNEDLVAWTGINNAPIAVYNDEPARAGWVEILMLAERIQPEPRLVPADEEQRAVMFGLAHALCSEDGFGWNRRLMFFGALAAQPADGQDAASLEPYERMRRKYGYGGNAAQAKARIISVLGLLSRRLRAQAEAGSRYYVGDTITAVDIYSACFMAMVRPLPIEQCPTSAEMHASYRERDPGILAAADPILLEHRDFIYANHLELPMRL